MCFTFFRSRNPQLQEVSEPDDDPRACSYDIIVICKHRQQIKHNSAVVTADNWKRQANMCSSAFVSDNPCAMIRSIQRRRGRSKVMSF